jgi:hypothetical protein
MPFRIWFIGVAAGAVLAVGTGPALANQDLLRTVVAKLEAARWILVYRNSRYGIGSSSADEARSEMESCFENGIAFDQQMIRLRCAGGKERSDRYSLGYDQQHPAEVSTMMLTVLEGDGGGWGYTFEIGLPRAESFEIARRYPDQLAEKPYFVFRLAKTVTVQ